MAACRLGQVRSKAGHFGASSVATVVRVRRCFGFGTRPRSSAWASGPVSRRMSPEDREAAALGEPVHPGLDRALDLAVDAVDVLGVVHTLGVVVDVDR